MKPERWQQVEELYHQALAVEPDERAAFLARVCAGDDELRREIESFLAFAPRAERFIEASAMEVAANLLAADDRQVEEGAGRRIGPYRILHLLAAGGMGEVYLAEDSRLGRKVALKLLPKDATDDRDRVRRFGQEARAASALNHPNILTIYDIGLANELHYIASEFIDGETLRQQLNAGKLDLRRTLDIACQVMSALAAAHKAGITHRDIKPENIMLRQDGYVKVLDFGLAKLTRNEGWMARLPASGEVKTEAGVVYGTIMYMSPEQARGLPVDARTDIFSFGVVLYEMIAGQAPFAGATNADIIAAILDRQPPALARFTSEIPETLEWMIGKALRKNRDERYQTAKELHSDLRMLTRRLEFEHDLERSLAANTRRDGVSVSGSLASRSAPGNDPAPVTPARSVIDSLAVLPLINTCAERGSDYFSDGISESIITTVSRLPELRVMAWSTVSRYRGEQVDPRRLGQDLGVRAVLTGRMMSMGEQLVIRTELVDASDGSHLWGGSYTCAPSDILAIEAKIAEEISENLLLRLTTDERRRLAQRYTGNTEAFHAYLRGRYFWNKRTDESVRQGIEHFKQAIELDPSYALAYAGLADSYIILGSFGIATLAPAEAFPKAREAALRALEIDDELAEAHASLAISLASYDWDWPRAESEFQRSLALKPGYATAHHWYGFIYLAAMGRLDDAIAEVKRAYELDPLSLSIGSDLGLLLYLARRYDAAIEEYQKTLEMEQHFLYSHWKLGLAYEQKAMYEAAIAELQKARALAGRSYLPMALLGHVLAIAGKRDEAQALAQELTEQARHSYVSAYRIAGIYSGLGQTETALAWLERAYQERDPWLIWMPLDPVQESLLAEPRVNKMLRRIGVTAGADLAPRPEVAGALSGQRKDTRRAAQKTITSLAILPLANTCDDATMEYFSDGITESIINILSQLPRLRVVARSTVFRYKDQAVDPREIGRLLGVQAVLTGRVRQIADRLIISAELIDVTQDAQLWGEHYNRNLADIFAVQEEIANEITANLRVKLSRQEKGRIGKRHTTNIEAYQAYLKGRYFWNKRTTEALKRGIEYFQQAIAVDPSYAPAYAGLSDSYTLLVIRAALSPEEGFAKAKAAARRALEIDDRLGEGHASLAHAQLHNWEWAAAESGFKRALELNPGYASTRHWHSEYLLATGQLEEAIQEVERARELDPLSLIINTHLADVLYFARQYDASIEQCRKSLEMDATFFLAALDLGRAYAQKGMYEKGLEQLQKARKLIAGSPEGAWLIGHTYAVAGRTEEARQVIEQVQEEAKRHIISPTGIAMIYTALGEHEEAFAWLEKAYAGRDDELFTVQTEPKLDPLRADPRFHDLLRRMGLAAVEARRHPERETKPTRPIRQTRRKGIAVLPFKPIQADACDEVLELGIADALISRLTGISQLVVRPTSAVRKYIGGEREARAAGRELKVQTVLEGSIQRVGDRIRVTAQLVQVKDGRLLWASQFDEQFTDIFAVEDSISEKVTAALTLRLSGAEKDRLTKRYTENTAAYHMYLKGRYYWNARSEEALQKSIDCFAQAIEMDPNYALAYAGLADSYTFLGDVGINALPPAEAFGRGKAAAARALAIDDGLAEAHASLGHLHMHLFEWQEAEQELQEAIRLKPNYATARQWHAYYLAFTGRLDEALEEIGRALELDPLSQPINADTAEILYFAGRYEEAIGQFQKTLELDARYYRGRLNLGRVYEQQGRYEEARAEYQTAEALASGNTEVLAAQARVRALAGDQPEAIRMMEELGSQAQRQYVSPYDLALIQAALGNLEQAFAWFDKAYDERAGWTIYISVDPRLDPLRDDPRFADLRRRVGL